MTTLPQEIVDAWKNREDAVVLTTVGKDGVANSIYATCVGLFDNLKIVIADNFFDKTRSNILSGSSGVVLFITKEGKSYQVKGDLEYHREGAVFDFMKEWNPEKLPGHAAAALVPNVVYSGSEKVG